LEKSQILKTIRQYQTDSLLILNEQLYLSNRQTTLGGGTRLAVGHVMINVLRGLSVRFSPPRTFQPVKMPPLFGGGISSTTFGASFTIRILLKMARKRMF